MGFRDDTEALRAHVETLEAELADARRELERARAVEDELVRLRARVSELEAILDTPEAKAARAKKESEQRSAEVAQRAEAAKPVQRRAAIGVVMGFVAIGGIAVFLGLRAAPAPWRASELAPTLGVLDVSSVQLPARFEGAVEVAEAAPRSCEGRLAEAPQLAIDTASPTTLVIEASSDTDTVLVLLDAEGTLRCDDDSAGDYNPRITTSVPRGRHRVWVGTYDSGDASFVLTVGGLAGPP
ncbi:MAG: hypothetical protein K1X94_25380 [Sandaracinaceae bacterium]|nr:hypothetical protein [Sandaracinaceae bacterium]